LFDENEIIRGMGLCLDNARQLASEAELLYTRDHYERSLALGILALEEVGKLVYINCLAFSLTESTQRKSFDNIRRQHHAKLFALHSYPMFLVQFAGLDHRFFTDDKWKEKLHGIVQEFQKCLLALEPWIGSLESIDDLHKWKQKAFYVDFDRQQGFTAPSAIDAGFTEDVLRLVHLIVRGLDFVVADNLDRYSEAISAIRSTVTSEQFDDIRQHISETLNRPH
jgi:AbiV family abortive infection protein